MEVGENNESGRSGTDNHGTDVGVSREKDSEGGRGETTLEALCAGFVSDLWRFLRTARDVYCTSEDAQKAKTELAGSLTDMVLLFLQPKPEPTAHYRVAYRTHRMDDEGKVTVSDEIYHYKLNCSGGPEEAENELRASFHDTMQSKLEILRTEEVTLTED